MLFSVFLLPLACLAVAQTPNNSTIDPSEVTSSVKSLWCTSQTSTCLILCGGNVSANTCSAPTLEFDCTCATNNSSPGLIYYTKTLPTLICQQVWQDCIVSAEDIAAQSRCNQNRDENCGKLDPAQLLIQAATTQASSPSISTTEVVINVAFTSALQTPISTADPTTLVRSTTPSPSSSNGPSNSTTTNSSSIPSSQSRNDWSIGAKAGIGAGVGIFAILLSLALAYFVVSYRYRGKELRRLSMPQSSSYSLAPSEIKTPQTYEVHGESSPRAFKKQESHFHVWPVELQGSESYTSR